MHRSISILLLTILLTASCLVSWRSMTEVHDWGGDFAGFIMQAQSIIDGNPTEFIEKNRFTIENSSRPVGPVAYPWGYPMLLAPFYAYFGFSMPALKSLNNICYLFFLLALWSGCRVALSAGWRLVLVSLFAIHPYFMDFLNYIGSDIPFLLFSTITIFIIGKIIIRKETLVSQPVDHLLMGLLIAISFFIRTQGILLLATLLATQFIVMIRPIINWEKTAATLLQESWDNLRPFSMKSLIRFLPAISPYFLFFLLVLIWSAFLPEGGASHVKEIKHISSATIRYNLLFYIKIPSEFFSGFYSKIALIMHGAGLPLFFFGMLKRRNTDFHMIIFGALYMTHLIVWPYTQGFRYLLPIIPFYIYFVLVGVASISDSRDQLLHASWKIGSGCMIILILLMSWKASFKSLSIAGSNLGIKEMGPYFPTAQDLFAYIKDQTDEDSIIIFFKPRVLRLYTNRPSIMIEQKDQIKRGDYLCIQNLKDGYNQIDQSDIDSLLASDLIQLLYQNSDFQFYRVRKPLR